MTAEAIRKAPPLRLSTSAAEFTRQELALSQIRRDGGTQARTGNSEDVVEEYTGAMREERWRWHDGNALTVFFDGEHHWLADGFHRCEAASRAGLLTIPCEVRAGSQREAVLYACGANDSHGLRRSRSDVRRAIEILLRDEEWGRWSNAEISRRVGCSDMTVGTVRRELESTSQIGRLSERIGADGKTRQASRPIPQPDTPEDLAAEGFRLLRSSQKPGQVKLVSKQGVDYYPSAPAATFAARERIKERNAPPPARPAGAPSVEEYEAAIRSFYEHGYVLSCTEHPSGRGCPPYWVVSPKGRPQRCEQWPEVAAALARLTESPPASEHDALIAAGREQGSAREFFAGEPERILTHPALLKWQLRASYVGCELIFDGTGYALKLPDGKTLVSTQHGGADVIAIIKEREAAHPPHTRCFDCGTTENVIEIGGAVKYLCSTCRVKRGARLTDGLSEAAVTRGWKYRNIGLTFEIEKNGMFRGRVSGDASVPINEQLEELRLRAIAEIESRVAIELAPVVPSHNAHPPCKACGVEHAILISGNCEACYLVHQAEQWSEGNPEAHWRLVAARKDVERDTNEERRAGRLARILDVAAALKIDLDAPPVAAEQPNPAPPEEFDPLEAEARAAGLLLTWNGIDARFAVYEGGKNPHAEYSYYGDWPSAVGRVRFLLDNSAPPAADSDPMRRDPEHERRYDQAEKILAGALEKLSADEAQLLAALLLPDEEYEPGLDDASETLWVLLTRLAHQGPDRLAEGLGEAQS